MPDATQCPGSCNAAYMRAKAIRDVAYTEYEALWDLYQSNPNDYPEPVKPEPLRLAAIPGEPVWCLRCAATIRRELAELDDLAARLVRESEGLRAAGDASAPKVAGSKDRSSPSPLLDLLDELESELRAYEDDLRGRPATARRGWLTSALTATIDWLCAHFDQAITHPAYAKDLGRDIRTWHRRLRGAGHAGMVRHRLKKPCPRCDQMSLQWEEGADHVQCVRPECGRLMSYADYRAYEELHPHLAPRQQVS